MKKRFLGVLILLLPLLLSGCLSGEKKAASFSVIYGVAAAVSLLLLLVCLLLVHKNRPWFMMLFTSVSVVNIGYTLLSVAPDLQFALMANRISYLGSVFLPFAMLMIILSITGTRYKKSLSYGLLTLSVLVFFIAASPGILDIYYKEVTFQRVDGVSSLVKVYGPLHPVYLVYLIGYFIAMVAIVIRSQIRKTIDSAAHAIVVAIAVLVNIGVWFIEQIASFQFEMLSISYIISELFLLGVHLVVKEHLQTQELLKQVSTAQNLPESAAPWETPIENNPIPPERIEAFIGGLERLTPTEREIYESYVARMTTSEVMAHLNIKETTLKYHNRNLYGKLCVSSRKDLLELHKHIQSVKARLTQSEQA